MLESMLRQSRLAYDAYWSDVREHWVLKWPGQVVQTISCHTWTKEVGDAPEKAVIRRVLRFISNRSILYPKQVEDAINEAKVPEYLAKSNAQIDGIVEVVRGPLSPGATITIEALVVLDVHGAYLGWVGYFYKSALLLPLLLLLLPD